MQTPTGRRILVVTVLTLLVACTPSQFGSQAVRGYDLSQYHSFFVVHSKPPGHSTEALILDALREQGLTATAGDMDQKPASAQALLYYKDAPCADEASCLSKISIEVRDAASYLVIASGFSSNNPEGTKTPDAMVREAMAFLDIEHNRRMERIYSEP